MQQTENRKFNIIETSDNFSPEALNDNTRKIEAALDKHEAKVDGRINTMDLALAAVTKSLGKGGKTARMAFGQYTGTGTYGQNNPTTLTFGFCPALVVIATASSMTNRSHTLLLRGTSTGRGTGLTETWMNRVIWADNSVQMWEAQKAENQNNQSNETYYYFAIGYDLDS